MYYISCLSKASPGRGKHIVELYNILYRDIKSNQTVRKRHHNMKLLILLLATAAICDGIRNRKPNIIFM